MADKLLICCVNEVYNFNFIYFIPCLHSAPELCYIFFYNGSKVFNLIYHYNQGNINRAVCALSL